MADSTEELVQRYLFELQNHRDTLQSVSRVSIILGVSIFGSGILERYLRNDLLFLLFIWSVIFVIIGVVQHKRFRKQLDVIERVIEETGVRPILG